MRAHAAPWRRSESTLGCVVGASFEARRTAKTNWVCEPRLRPWAVAFELLSTPGLFEGALMQQTALPFRASGSLLSSAGESWVIRPALSLRYARAHYGALAVSACQHTAIDGAERKGERPLGGGLNADPLEGKDALGLRVLTALEVEEHRARQNDPPSLP